MSASCSEVPCSHQTSTTMTAVREHNLCFHAGLINTCYRPDRWDGFIPLQNLEHQTGQKPQTVHSFWDETSPDKLPETSGYSSSTGTKVRNRKKMNFNWMKLIHD